MAANKPRGTPGMILLGFAGLCAIVALGAARETWRGARPEAQALTGLGDTAYYDRHLAENDFFGPALVFGAEPRGLHRRTVHPVHRDDSKMRRSGLEHSGRHIVYTDAVAKPGPDGRTHKRWYLKAGDDHYVEFGERKYFENFGPVKKK